VSRSRIFLAAPILKFLTAGPGGRASFDTEARRLLEALAAALQETGAELFLAHREEGFGESRPRAEVLTARDLDAMRQADLVVAWPSDSYGVHIELGWASALGKPIIVLRDGDG
jgi:nucleoside 2-deoxyribosyltransferase